METKQIKCGVEIKEIDDEGSGLARIATLSAVDSDGDTYASGAFGEQDVKVMPAHDYRAVPIGKGRVFERGDEALAAFRLNMATDGGRQWHAALKFDLDAEQSGGRPLQEWSYGFEIMDAAEETRDEERVRVLKRLKVFEISPVVIGAGVDTATLAVKHGRPFARQMDEALAEIDDLIARARGLAELRGSEGRTLSTERLEALSVLKARLERLATAAGELDDLVGAGGPSPAEASAKAGRLLAEFEAIRSGTGRAAGGPKKSD